MYKHFYSHLPENLFFEDFVQSLNKSNKLTFKHYAKVFADIDAGNDGSEQLKMLAHKVTCLELVEAEDPVVEKLVLYTIAHKNYLDSLPLEVMRDYKVNWGLKKTMKIGE